MTQTPTAIETFLAPLARLAARHPEILGEVVWGDSAGWQAQDDAAELLDAEEIAFYAEGLLAEGFALHWQALAEASEPEDPIRVILKFWQPPATPPPLAKPADWLVMASGHWDAPAPCP